ncbi:hypothetical protein ABZV93_28055 [Actinopolymorpha sp. NPDC004070]|uniref:hypothetical protein n=1 Tax=Actinopolymorpha sp. NPDC004070 TaxID=3154548 RepID=UPI0033BAB46D
MSSWLTYGLTGRDASTFRQIVKAAGLPPTEWTPRELRHSFVSLLSDAGVPLARLFVDQAARRSVVTQLVTQQMAKGVPPDGDTPCDLRRGGGI